MLQRAVQAQLVSAQFAELQRNSFKESSIEAHDAHGEILDEAHDAHGEIQAVGVGTSGPLVEWEPSTDTACVEGGWVNEYADERTKKRFRVDDWVRAASSDAD